MIKSFIKKELTDIGVCEFCQLYFNKEFETRVTTGNCLRSSEVFQLDKIAATDFVSKVCVNCIGLCQLVNNKEFLNWIVFRLKESNYEFDSINFNFRLPLSIKLRQKYILNRLKKLFNENQFNWEEGDIFDFDLKLSIKNCLNVELAQLLSVPVSNKDEFIINLEFKNPEDEEALVN